MTTDGLDARLRTAAMAWLRELTAGTDDQLVTAGQVAEFYFEGERVPLMDRQRGIRKPRILDAALSFRTTFTPPGQLPPYYDAEGPDGLLRYKYRGDNPNHPDNRALRQAFERQLPLIWFYGVLPGFYLPRFPVWLRADEPEELQFAVALDQGQLMVPAHAAMGEDQRDYVNRLTKQRLHQPVFRARVLRAYDNRCAMCRLRHVALLDAAHILRDGHPRGLPVVPNGLALCKIHHAAYDADILGVRPDLVIEVRSDILVEIDGPMLQHGLKEMAGVHLTVPSERQSRPDRDALEERYEKFRTAS